MQVNYNIIDILYRLQTIDYDGSEEKELKMENGNLKDNKSNSISKIYQNNDISYSEGKVNISLSKKL